MGSWGNDTTYGVYCKLLHVSHDVARGQGVQCHARPPSRRPGRHPQTQTRPREVRVVGEPRTQKKTK
eukprot:12550360-Alexandrium_andersonii.AAC.1